MRSLDWTTKGSKGEIYECCVKIIDETKTIYFLKCTCWNFVNCRIEKSGYFSDIKYFSTPCKHLRPVVEALEKQGYILKKPKPMEGTDKCTPELRRKLIQRAQGLCECGCGRPGEEAHRKIAKTNGGKYNESNCLLLNTECHRAITFQKWQGTPGSKGQSKETTASIKIANNLNKLEEKHGKGKKFA